MDEQQDRAIIPAHVRIGINVDAILIENLRYNLAVAFEPIVTATGEFVKAFDVAITSAFAPLGVSTEAGNVRLAPLLKQAWESAEGQATWHSRYRRQIARSARRTKKRDHRRA